MSGAVGPGDWVECVNDTPTDDVKVCAVRLGQVYRVRRILHDLGWGPGLVLCEVKPASGVAAFHLWRFRPIRSDISELEHLLTLPIPADLQQEDA